MSKIWYSGALLVSWERMGGQVVAYPKIARIGERKGVLHSFNNTIPKLIKASR